MSRPTKEESIYKVSIHKNGGYMYAATHPYTVDENGNRKYVYCHWGVVDEKKKFILSRPLFFFPFNIILLFFVTGYSNENR